MRQQGNIEAQALALSPPEREALANRLVESLENEPLSEIDEAWLRVAEQRFQAYLEGREDGIPADRLFAELKQTFGCQT